MNNRARFLGASLLLTLILAGSLALGAFFGLLGGNRAADWDSLDSFNRIAMAAIGEMEILPRDRAAIEVDASQRDLNRQFRGLDRPTNVLSFPAEDDFAPLEGVAAPPRLLGDLALALETCSREAEEQGKSLADHVAHLTVHGLLHLLGYDHQTDAEAERMEGRERRILEGLEIADPYLASSPEVAA